LVVGLFFVALAIPTAVLVARAVDQLKWESFYHYQRLAEELANRVDKQLRELIARQELYSYADYSFLTLVGDPAAGFRQRSPLSAFPPDASIPGLIGYFQVDAQGLFSTPLLPESEEDPTAYGVDAEEKAARWALQERILAILGSTRIAQPQPTDRPTVSMDEAPLRQRLGSELAGSAIEAEERDRADAVRGGARSPANEISQEAFDRLSEQTYRAPAFAKSKIAGSLGRVEELNLDARFQERLGDELKDAFAKPSIAEPEKKPARKKRPPPREPLAQQKKESGTRVPGTTTRVDIFESEIDPLELGLLDSGQFVLFRKVWRDGERSIQGLLLERQPFLQGVVDAPFRDSVLMGISDLVIAFRGSVLTGFGDVAPERYLSSAGGLRGTLLHRARLSSPWSDVELIFGVQRLPVGPGADVIAWLAAILALILSGGLFLIYRLSLRQLQLARQQQDFVSAVSHELKTPLTSIRLYSEMLCQGWASEEKREGYYRFIHDESERLSRLIGNVLQLARITRNELRVEPEPVAIAELVEGVRRQLAVAAERAGFELCIDCREEVAGFVVQADPDCFAQILINLVDNAIKFAAKADERVVEVGCRRDAKGVAVVSVRDYGPGVPRDQARKIFRLFYRVENGLTRETSGTGIGLALVRQLAEAMGAKVEVENRAPGAEFRVLLAPGGQRGGRT